MSDGIVWLRWVLLLEALGWAVLPLARRLFPGARLGASGLARPLGVFLWAFGLWWVGSLAGLPASPWPLWGAVGLLALACWLGLPDARPRLKGEGRALLVGTLVAVGAFLLVALMRGFNPRIAATEKPMDLAFLSSAIRAQRYPFPDPWLSGYPVNYYYFGYLWIGLLARATGTPPWIAFNLGVAAAFSLAASAAWGLAVAWTGRLRGGLLAPVAWLIVGNAHAPWRLLREPARVLRESWWEGIGWHSSRVVIDHLPTPSGPLRWPTINEFPAFSFILADLHPHLTALPLTAVALAWVSERLGEESPFRPLDLAAGGFLLGGLYFANSWDFPTYALLALLAAAWPWRRLDRARIGRALAAVALAFPLYLPFFLTFRSFAGAEPPSWVPALLHPLARTVGPVLDRTEVGEFLQMWGIWALLSLLLLRFPSTPAPRGWGRRWLLLGGVAVVLGGLLDFPLLPLLPWGLALLERAREEVDPRWRRIWLLQGVGWLLIWGCEVVYLRDVFDNRMNTVFKVYYQAWTLLALSTAAALLTGWRERRAWAGVGLALLLLPGLTYAPLSAYKMYGGFRTWQGWDGLAWRDPAEQAVIRWLWSRPGTPVLLEATGPAYHDAYGRVSAATGLPTVLGWANHEGQWRRGQPEVLAQIPVREGDVERIYASPDLEEARRLLMRYGVRFIIVGKTERQRYPAEGLQKFEAWSPVFQQDGVQVYEVKPP